MSGSVTEPTKDTAQDYGTQAHGVIQGTNTQFDGKIAQAMVLIDPATGLPAMPSTVSGGGITASDGAIYALGATADVAGASTVVGQLKALNADTADMETAIGAAADAANAPTVLGQLKQVIVDLAELETNLGTTSDTTSDDTVIGLLKQILEPATPMARSDTYTAQTTGTAVNASTGDTPVAWAIQVKATGTLGSTTWNVVLEASLDGINYTTVLTHQTSTGDGVVLHTAAFPALYFRSRVTDLTLDTATNIVVHILGKA